MNSTTAFYNTHAQEFSNSRFRIWKHVRDFLDSLPVGAKVLEIGCGNGKNMLYRGDLQMCGIDTSDSLVEICAQKGLDVLCGDARALPFRDGCFDAIIMVAVIHHIHPDLHYGALEEIQRVLKPGGRCFITNWATEQPADGKRVFHRGLNNVLWKGKESTPLPYWIMDKDDARVFAQNMPPSLECSHITWDAGNWEFWIHKGGKN